jgi:hypothetical protein
MSNPDERRDQIEVPKLTLSRETLRDLDAPRSHAHEIKGGGCGSLHMNDSCCKAATISKKLN